MFKYNQVYYVIGLEIKIDIYLLLEKINALINDEAFLSSKSFDSILDSILDLGCEQA